MGISNLQQSSQQTEDALSQGMEALQQSLAETLSSGSLGSSNTSGNVANYMGQMATAMGKLGTLEGFIRQVCITNFLKLISQHPQREENAFCHLSFRGVLGWEPIFSCICCSNLDLDLIFRCLLICSLRNLSSSFRLSVYISILLHIHL